MKINELRLKNFINHADTEISFERVNVFVGPNGAGKTTILNGIEWALTGSCRGMAKKKDAAGIIQHGKKSAEVWLEFEKDDRAYYIDRRCTPSNTTLVFGQGDSVIARGLQEAQEKIYEVLDITAEIASNLFDVFALPEMTPFARKKVIQSVMATEGTEALADYLEEKGFGNIPKDRMDDIIKAYQVSGLGGDNNGAYGYAVQMRRAYKRQLGEIPKQEPPVLGDDGDLKGKSADDLKVAMDHLTREREEMLKAQAYDAGQVDADKESMRLMEEEIAKVQGQIEEMGNVEGEIKDAEENYRKSTEALVEIIKQAPECDDFSQLQASLKQLESMGEMVSQKSIKAVAARLKVIEEDTGLVRSEYLLKLGECQDVDAEMKKAAVAANEKAAEFNQFKAQNEQNSRILEGLKADLTKAESQKDTGLSPDQLAEKLNKLESDIALSRTRLEQLTRYDEYMKSLSGIKEQEKALSARIASWDKLAEALNPKNPDLKILMGTTFGTFQELFSSASRALGVPSTVNDEDFSIESFPDGRKSPVEWLSHSEVYRVGIALELALCSILGIRTVIIDEGEILFDECKQDLSGLISAPSNYIDCFVLLATGELQSLRPSEGIVVCGVKDGKVLDK